MCSDNPGSNAPRSNISVNGAHVLSVQNFPADDQLDVRNVHITDTDRQTVKVNRLLY